MLILLLTFTLALVASVTATFWARGVGHRVGMVDRPDGFRRLHTNAVPRVGGAAVFLGAALALTVPPLISVRSPVAMPPALLPLGGAAAVIFLLGLVDDIRDLKATTKFLVEFAVAVGLYLLGLRLGSVSVGETLLFALPAWLDLVLFFGNQLVPQKSGFMSRQDQLEVARARRVGRLLRVLRPSRETEAQFREFAAVVAWWFGSLEVGGFDSKARGWENTPNVALGYALDAVLLSVKAEAILTTSYSSFNGENEVSSNQNLFSGVAFAFYIEQPAWKNTHLTLGFRAAYTKFHWMTWALFSTFDRYLFYPEFTMGFIL